MYFQCSYHIILESSCWSSKFQNMNEARSFFENTSNLLSYLEHIHQELKAPTVALFECNNRDFI